MVVLSSVIEARLWLHMSDFSTLRFSPVSLDGEETKTPSESARIQSSTDSVDDATLIRSQGQGNREACSCLFARYAQSVWNIGRRVLGNPTEADDLVQDVFLYLYKKWNIFDAKKGSGRSWIFQVAYTQALLRRRELKAHGFYVSRIPDRSIEGSASCRHEEANYDQSVEGLFGRNGWRKVIEELSEDQRETLRLHFFEGLTFAEIAEKLGQSHRNIRNHHYRGLEKLRKHIAKSKLNLGW